MPTLDAVELPLPLNWQDFESLCCDLWREIWNDPNTQMHGRRGQPQSGVDVFGRPEERGEWAGVQCKLKSQLADGKLSRAEIEAEVEKARTFNPRLASLTIATTAPRSTETQELARLVTAAQSNIGSFPVTVASWDDLMRHLAAHPDLIAKHYPDFQLKAGSAWRARCEDYLRTLYSRMVPLPLMGVGSSAYQQDIPLAAVYTSLDVAATVRANDREAAKEAAEGRQIGSRSSLRGETWYLEQLAERVDLEARAAAKARDAQERTAEKDGAYERRCTAVEAAAAAPRLVLTGAAGSGKSSFARHLALCLAGERLGRREANLERLNRPPATDTPEGKVVEGAPEPPWPHGPPLPIFVELRKLVQSPFFDPESGVCDLLEYLRAEDSKLAAIVDEHLKKREKHS